MKILVFGGRGQLGNDLLPELQRAGHEIIAPTRVECDITYARRLRDEYLPQSGAECIINCAAFHKLADCEEQPLLAYNVNSYAPAVMADWCRETGARFVHMSTDYVFDGKASYPYEENSPCSPLQIYGTTKLAGELCVRVVNKQSIIIRTSSLFGHAGSSGKGGNFVNSMIAKMAGNSRIEVVDDVVMSPTSTTDLVRAITQLLTVEDASGIYHATNSRGCSWYEFACEIKRQSGLGGELVLVTLESRGEPYSRPRYSVLGHHRLQEAGITMRPWHEALEEYLHG